MLEGFNHAEFVLLTLAKTEEPNQKGSNIAEYSTGEGTLVQNFKAIE